jgi:hypothetical protein
MFAMSVSNRIIAGVFGLAIFCGIAWGVYSTGYIRGEQAEKYQSNTNKYSRQAEKYIGITCAGLNGIPQVKCIRDVIESTNQHKRAEGDLVAQKSMALWAFLMLVVTVAMALITFAGVYYVWRTLLATQKMASDTREIGNAQTRAYLGVDEAQTTCLLNPAYPGKLYFVITHTNFGNTPAFNAEVETVLIDDDKVPTTLDEAWVGESSSIGNVFPGASNSHNVSIFDLINFKGAGKETLFFSRVRYNDVFGHRFEIIAAHRVGCIDGNLRARLLEMAKNGPQPIPGLHRLESQYSSYRDITASA